jgi:hypothetical protein
MKTCGAFVLAMLLAGCARGGGIGLEAKLADHNCEQAAYQPGTPHDAACPMELARAGRTPTPGQCKRTSVKQRPSRARHPSPGPCWSAGC